MLWAQCLSHLPVREKVKTYNNTLDGTSDPIFNRVHEVSNDIRQDTNSTKDPYPWLEPDHPRRHHTDAEILRS